MEAMEPAIKVDKRIFVRCRADLKEGGRLKGLIRFFSCMENLKLCARSVREEESGLWLFDEAEEKRIQRVAEVEERARA